MKQLDVASDFLDFLSSLYQNPDAPAYPGERISLTEHMLQCASVAVQQSQNKFIIAAALLHDVGHLLSPYFSADESSRDHEDLGAWVLQDYFPLQVTECIRLHVEAKRYLCTTEKNYLASLSAACAGTFDGQGGEMSTSELTAFSSHQYVESLLTVRRIDDVAIVDNLESDGFDQYRILLLEIMQDHIEGSVYSRVS